MALEYVPRGVLADQTMTIEATDMSESPEANLGLDHGIQDTITPTLGFFDDIFDDLSPSYVQDIGWTMRPTGLFDDWSSGERQSTPVRYETAIGHD